MGDEDPKDHDVDQPKDAVENAEDAEPKDHDVDQPKDAVEKREGEEEEEPKDQDVDQPKDAPRQRPTVHIDPNIPRRTQSDNAQESSGSRAAAISPSQQNVASPMAFGGRHSMQLSQDEHIPRRSTQMSRGGNGRPSRDFDQRRDGPYGRPSLTMTRRKSSATFTMPPKTPTMPPKTHTMPIMAPAVAVESAGEEAKEEGEEAPSDQPLESMKTMQSTDAAFEPEPPSLNYTLKTRRLSIAVFWSLILIDSIAMPIVLYFCLWYDTDLNPNTVFSIVTAALGGISIVEYFLRFRRLWRKDSTCRVIGARRMYLDWFHWNFSFAWFVVMIELIVGTVFTHPPIRLLSMPLASMCYAFGVELMIVDIMRYFQVPAPCRISSIPKGAQLRPGIYSIIEDVCAVDGSGGTEFRENLNRRYEASHIFRAMLRRLGEYWAVGSMGAAIVTTILVFTVSKDAAYAVGWSLPFIWAGIWTLGTIIYVKKKLREERKAWAEEVATKSNA